MSTENFVTFAREALGAAAPPWLHDPSHAKRFAGSADVPRDVIELVGDDPGSASAQFKALRSGLARLESQFAAFAAAHVEERIAFPNTDRCARGQTVVTALRMDASSRVSSVEVTTLRWTGQTFGNARHVSFRVGMQSESVRVSWSESQRWAETGVTVLRVPDPAGSGPFSLLLEVSVSSAATAFLDAVDASAVLAKD